MIDRATSFDRTAAEYERTRPDYPDAILDLLPLARESTVVDIGAGTGKLTRVLARRYEHVIAVEPLDAMRDILQRVVTGAQALKGTAEQIPLPSESADGVFCAQAFHWFDKAKAMPEISRVLRPGGVFVVVWNGSDESRANPLPAGFYSELQALHDAALMPGHDEPRWEEVLERSGFTDVHGRTTVPHDHVLDRDAMVENLRTISWIACRDDRDEAVERLASLLPQGTYAMPNLAHILWGVRP